MTTTRVVPVEIIVACARKLHLVGELYSGDKESRELADALDAIAAAPPQSEPQANAALGPVNLKRVKELFGLIAIEATTKRVDPPMTDEDWEDKMDTIASFADEGYDMLAAAPPQSTPIDHLADPDSRERMAKCPSCEQSRVQVQNAEARKANAFELFHRYYLQCRALRKGIKRLHRKIARLEKAAPVAQTKPTNEVSFRMADLPRKMPSTIIGGHELNNAAATQGESIKESWFDGGININLHQAQEILAFFGGEDADMTLKWLDKSQGTPTDDLDDQPETGLHIWCTDYPEEGVAYIHETPRNAAPEQAAQTPLKSDVQLESLRPEPASDATLILPVLEPAPVAAPISHLSSGPFCSGSSSQDICIKCGATLPRETACGYPDCNHRLKPNAAAPQIEGTQEQTHERTFPPSSDDQSSDRPAAAAAAPILTVGNDLSGLEPAPAASMTATPVSTLPLTRETIEMLDMACNEETFDALRKQALAAIELERQLADALRTIGELTVSRNVAIKMVAQRTERAKRAEQQVAEKKAELALSHEAHCTIVDCLQETDTKWRNAEAELAEARIAMDEVERSNGDAPHRAVNLAARIKVSLGELKARTK